TYTNQSGIRTKPVGEAGPCDTARRSGIRTPPVPMHGPARTETEAEIGATRPAFIGVRDVARSASIEVADGPGRRGSGAPAGAHSVPILARRGVHAEEDEEEY